MKTIVCICVYVSLALFLPQMASAGGKQKKGGGAKAAPAAAAGKPARLTGGGGFNRGSGPRMGGGAPHNSRGGGNNIHNAGKTGHGQHGLNAHQGGQHGLNAHKGGQHGLNAHEGPRQGLNARASNDLKGHHAGNALGYRGGNNRFTAGNQASHWRSGVRWRNSHALYAGYHRVWHDRGWWRGHYNHVAFVGGAYWGGYWYWDGGYWFPAWGYDPAYVGYVYDGPVFAYANLPPDQVVVNVQEALQDQGYYRGDVDGQLGTQTRDALAAYQRDHELEVSSAIDEATVQSLGLTNEEA
jgi:hypothetical protein